VSGLLCDPLNMQAPADPDDWFAKEGTPRANRAVTTCLRCPARKACGEYAEREGIPDGIFGGVTAERRHQKWHKQGGKPKDHMQNYNEHLAIIGVRTNRGAA
jgi:hypothetical protein